MTTAIDLITRSLNDIGVLGAGEEATTDQANTGLVYLNDLIQSLDNEGLIFFNSTTDTLAADGSTSYTLGLLGDSTAARPITVQSVYFSVGGYDYTPVSIISREQYEAISDKDSTSTIPYAIYIDYTYPLATAYPYPVASSGSLKISSTKPLDEPATLTTALAFPKGYERMLRLNLGVEQMPQYGRQDQLIMQMASDAKKAIMRVNSNNNPIVVGLGLPVSNGYRGVNVYSGY